MKKNINYGLLILKSILAFYVVKTHCFNIKSINNKFLFYILGKNRKIHVPAFFNMSFYFNYKGLISKESIRNCKRFERLLIPYIFWPIIVYLINIILFKCYKFPNKFNLRDLIIQLLLGVGIISPLWFQLNLMLTTLLFIFVIYIFKNHYLSFLQFLMIFSYYLQYSKYRDLILRNSKYKLQISIIREIMVIPFAVTGFSLAANNIINILQKYKYKTFIFSSITFIFIDIFNIFINMNDYNGVQLNILSTCLIFIFSLFSFVKIKSKYLYIIEYITKYSAGIYYLHTTVYLYLKNYIFAIRKGTIRGTFLIYIICYLISYSGMSLFGKTKAKNLFT